MFEMNIVVIRKWTVSVRGKMVVRGPGEKTLSLGVSVHLLLQLNVCL